MKTKKLIKEIAIIEDNQNLNKLLNKELKREGFQAYSFFSWGEAKSFLEENPVDLIILDIRLSDVNGFDILPDLSQSFPVIVITAYGRIEDAIKAIKLGAEHYLPKPVSIDELILTIQKIEESLSLKRKYYLKKYIDSKEKTNLVGESKAIKELKKQIKQVASEDIPVLILGESGVGKEVVAKEIHEKSSRKNENFVVVDCTTIQENLFESELFGHEKGAFTGADRKKTGLIEIAKNGTLFLDEIGEIPISIQAKLLRVLETETYRPVGSPKYYKANVRFIAATNRDLEKFVEEKKFRLDLLYRINVFTIYIPPLRERKEDIPLLAKHFLNKLNRRKEIDQKAIDKLMEYDYPGNVRELRNIIERAVILSGKQEIIKPEHISLPSDVNNICNEEIKTIFADLFSKMPTAKEIEYEYIRYLYKKFSGNKKKIAETSGISERHIYRILKKLNLS